MTATDVMMLIEVSGSGLTDLHEKGRLRGRCMGLDRQRTIRGIKVRRRDPN